MSVNSIRSNYLYDLLVGLTWKTNRSTVNCTPAAGTHDVITLALSVGLEVGRKKEEISERRENSLRNMIRSSRSSQ